MCVFIACMCVCVFQSEYQRGEERKGRPGNNNHPSTTGAFVKVCRTLGLNECFACVHLCLFSP